MLLRLGEVPTLVVSSREAAREVMKTHDTVFATRPLSPTMRALTKGGRGIIMAPYGAHWRQLRRITITKLLSARHVNSFRAVREEEAAAMLRACAAAAAAGPRSRPVDMRARLSALITDTTMRAAMGDRFKDREVFLRALDRAIVLSAGFNANDLWPSSRIVSRLSSAVRDCEEVRDTVFGILDGIIEEHLERMGNGDGGEVEDLLDVLLKVQQDRELSIPIDKEVIKCVIIVSNLDLINPIHWFCTD
jgi:cytochrome P450